jgi:hypothetical protein
MQPIYTLPLKVAMLKHNILEKHAAFSTSATMHVSENTIPICRCPAIIAYLAMTPINLQQKGKPLLKQHSYECSRSA